MREIQIENYCQIGINKSALIKIPDNGGLMVILGENNVGKTKVLDAISALGNKNLSKDDRPNFFRFDESKQTKITLTQQILTKTKEESIPDENLFLGKIFGVTFTKNSLNVSSQKQGLFEVEYVQKVNDELENQEIYAIHDYDDENDEKRREEIKLIIPKLKKAFHCSTRRGGEMLECFGVFDREFEKIKNYQKATKVSCKFCFFADKNNTKETKLDDARELKSYLSDKFKNINKTSSNVYETYKFNISLDSNNTATWNTTYPWHDAYKTIKNEFQKLLKWYNETDDKNDRYRNHDREIFNELQKNIVSALFHQNYHDFERYYKKLSEISKELKERKNRAYYYDNKEIKLPAFANMKALVAELLSHEIKMPNIIFYKE